MKKYFLISFLLIAVCYSCNNNDKKDHTTSENDVDAARNFIRAALDGKWNQAKKFMVEDSVNVQLLETTEKTYNAISNENKRNYRESEIIWYETRTIGDSITIVNYANSFKNEKDSLKVVRNNGQWLVDLKYSLLARGASKNGQ